VSGFFTRKIVYELEAVCTLHITVSMEEAFITRRAMILEYDLRL
jgi:hypothetical protein